MATAFRPRGDSLTGLTADFTSNLLCLSSTAESCKCHYCFCHHHHRLKHQLLPLLHLLFRTNEIAADVHNRGFICGISKVISPCRSVHILSVSDRPGERPSYTTYSLWLGVDRSEKGWVSSPPPTPQRNFLSCTWCDSRMST